MAAGFARHSVFTRTTEHVAKKNSRVGCYGDIGLVSPGGLACFRRCRKEAACYGKSFHFLWELKSGMAVKGFVLEADTPVIW